MHFTVTVSQVEDQVERPFTTWASRKWQKLTLPGAMSFATCQLTLKASVGIFGAILFHGRPVTLVLE